MIGWLIPWEPSFVVPCALFFSAALYVRGCAITSPPIAHRVFYALGLVLFYVALFTDFDYYAEHAFFMHRLQHAIIHHIAPFLIAVSQPGRVIANGLPDRMRDSMRCAVQFPPISRTIDILNHPVVAVALFLGLTVIWLIPQIHFVAMLDWRYYRLMNWSMAINGLMFWNLVLNNYNLKPARLAPATRILMMLAAVPPQIVAGALIFMAPHDLYAIYSICGRAFAGMAPLADQQIGGFIIWGPTAMMSVPGIILVARREWINRYPPIS